MDGEPIYQGRYVSWGPPGTGKTTWMATQVKTICQRLAGLTFPLDTPVIVCSLTRAAAAEAAGRDLPIDRGSVGTLHSFAYRSLGSPAVSHSRIAEWNEEFKDCQIGESTTTLDEPAWDRKPGGKAGDELTAKYDVLRAKMVPRILWPEVVQEFAAMWEDWKKQTGTIDFTDMIELAWRNCPNAPGNPAVVLADEVQDYSRLEIELLNAWGDNAGATIITGDPWQALYTWRGADPDAPFNQHLGPDREKVLSQSYRIPVAVHATAMRWIEKLSTYRPIEYKPRDAPGEVRFSDGTFASPGKLVNEAAEYLDQGKSVMFAASCGYFLDPLIKTLRGRGIPFANPWRAKRGDWNPLKLGGKGITMPQRILSFLALDAECGRGKWWNAEELQAWASVLEAKGLMLRGGKKNIERRLDADDQAAVDKALPDLTGADLLEWFDPEQIRAICNLFFRRNESHNTAGQSDVPLAALLDWWQSRLLAGKGKAAEYPLSVISGSGPQALKERPRLYVGTIHSFKGGEADCVFLCPDLSPAGYREWLSNGEGRDSVMRLMYVGITRAKEKLILCDQSTTLAANVAREVA